MGARWRMGWLLLAVLTLAVSGCGGGSPAVVSASVVEAMSGGAAAGVDADAFARAVEPITFVFPRDHGPHNDYRTEWWYYTGNLQDTAGNAYGYQLTFFRSALAAQEPQRTSELATNQVYMAHFALTDAVRGEHESFERFSRGAGGLAGAQGEPSFQVWLEDWSAVQVGEGEQPPMRLLANAEGQDGPVALDLTLRQTRPPLLQGDQGLDQKGPEPGNASYYYSLVGLETSGVITSAGNAVEVTGLSWMDHEFGTSALSGDAVGWDWFSLQLDNGAALMTYLIRTADGGFAKAKGALAWPDGSQSPITQDDFTIEVTGEWVSPRTGFRYPSGWRMTLPQEDAVLEVTPLIPDQEMDVSFIYWEGAVHVSGTWGGAAVSGQGYIELTGYGGQTGAYQR